MTEKGVTVTHKFTTNMLPLLTISCLRGTFLRSLLFYEVANRPIRGDRYHSTLHLHLFLLLLMFAKNFVTHNYQGFNFYLQTNDTLFSLCCILCLESTYLNQHRRATHATRANLMGRMKQPGRMEWNIKKNKTKVDDILCIVLITSCPPQSVSYPGHTSYFVVHYLTIHHPLSSLPPCFAPHT